MLVRRVKKLGNTGDHGGRRRRDGAEGFGTLSSLRDLIRMVRCTRAVMDERSRVPAKSPGRLGVRMKKRCVEDCGGMGASDG